MKQVSRREFICRSEAAQLGMLSLRAVNHSRAAFAEEKEAERDRGTWTHVDILRFRCPGVPVSRLWYVKRA